MKQTLMSTLIPLVVHQTSEYTTMMGPEQVAGFVYSISVDLAYALMEYSLMAASGHNQLLN